MKEEHELWGEGQWEKDKQAGSLQIQMRDSIAGPQDHDLSRTQVLLTELN